MKNTAVARKLAKIVFGDAIVRKTNVEVVSVHVLLLIENVIQMYADIAGSVVVMEVLAPLAKKVIITNAGT